VVRDDAAGATDTDIGAVWECEAGRDTERDTLREDVGTVGDSETLGTCDSDALAVAVSKGVFVCDTAELA